MGNSVKHHPSLSLLEQFCDGSLTPEVALLVATHLDFCPHCQRLSKDIEADLACSFAAAPVAAGQDDWLSMMQQVLAEAETTAKPVIPSTDPVVTNLEVGGHQFELPRALQRLSSKRSKWLTLGGIATARLPSGEPHHISLLFIDKNTAVPQHTHKGLEMTLVLAGEMVDEQGRYVPGDLIINTPDDTHTPRNVSDDPCLCLSVLSAPLQFKQGMTRLLNPLQRFFY